MLSTGDMFRSTLSYLRFNAFSGGTFKRSNTVEVVFYSVKCCIVQSSNIKSSPVDYPLPPSQGQTSTLAGTATEL